MEDPEMPMISLNRAETRGLFGLVGDRSAIEELIASDDRRTGFARLEVMVNTVLDRLTAPDGDGHDADRAART